MQRVFYFLALLIVFSCSSEPAQKESNYSPDQLKQKKQAIEEVMEVHDEAMAWMDQIQQLKSKLTDKMPAEEKDTMLSVYTGAIADLEQADEIMMAWMRNYKAPSDTADFGQVMEYLEGQKKDINEVRTQMKAAIDRATPLSK